MPLTRVLSGRPGPARAALLLGAIAAGLAQLASPVGRPLYDGIIPYEPYRYLTPVSGQVGQPTSFSGDFPVSGGQSPAITAATTENPPQAQLIAGPGAFVVPAGVTSLKVSITPVEPTSLPSTGQISGNVYRVLVAGAGGETVGVAPGQQPTLAMRAPGGEGDAVMMALQPDGGWAAVPTSANTALLLYTAQVDGLGDFAIVDRAPGGVSRMTLLVAATVGIVGAAIVVWAIRLGQRRRALAAAGVRPPGRGATRAGGGGPGDRLPSDHRPNRRRSSRRR